MSKNDVNEVNERVQKTTLEYPDVKVTITLTRRTRVLYSITTRCKQRDLIAPQEILIYTRGAAIKRYQKEVAKLLLVGMRRV